MTSTDLGLCLICPPDHEPRPCDGDRCSFWRAGGGRCLLAVARERRLGAVRLSLDEETKRSREVR